mmetsp:Transcript_104180/g.335878  ORF Transcript_104180/g.335878 Transcript_104180/m.335878 type:complete len:224 (-) Transcript_104180:250-921(-)
MLTLEKSQLCKKGSLSEKQKTRINANCLQPRGAVDRAPSPPRRRGPRENNDFDRPRLGLRLSIGVGDLTLHGVHEVELGEETAGFAILLEELPQAMLIYLLGLILLQVADNLSAMFDLAVPHLDICLRRERSAGAGLPDMLLAIVAIAHGTGFVRDEVAETEADAGLPGHGGTTACRHGFHKGLGVRVRDDAQAVDGLVRRHDDAGILDGDGQIHLVGADLDE